jgi:prepilin-type N-terminal cleavage/methylation domain-containing protein
VIPTPTPAPATFASARACPNAFTLIELLAVIAIASLVLAVAVVSISAMNDHVALERTAAMVRSMDARGRVFAKSNGDPVALVFDQDARQLGLVSVRGALPFALGELAADIEMSLDVSDPERHVIFDTRGMTDDYSVVVWAQTRGVRLSFHGLTGAVVMAEGPS